MSTENKTPEQIWEYLINNRIESGIVAKNDEYSSPYENCFQQGTKFARANVTKIPEVRELIEALKFYEIEIKYEPIRQKDVGSISWDKGKKAREALRKLRGEK